MTISDTTTDEDLQRIAGEDGVPSIVDVMELLVEDFEAGAAAPKERCFQDIEVYVPHRSGGGIGKVMMYSARWPMVWIDDGYLDDSSSDAVAFYYDESSGSWVLNAERGYPAAFVCFAEGTSKEAMFWEIYKLYDTDLASYADYKKYGVSERYQIPEAEINRDEERDSLARMTSLLRIHGKTIKQPFDRVPEDQDKIKRFMYFIRMTDAFGRNLTMFGITADKDKREAQYRGGHSGKKFAPAANPDFQLSDYIEAPFDLQDIETAMKRHYWKKGVLRRRRCELVDLPLEKVKGFAEWAIRKKKRGEWRS